MTQAATTSPFAANDAPWLIWKQQFPVNMLYEQERNGVKPDADAAASEGSEWDENAISSAYPIQRKQYHAVLNRFDRARSKTGGFSAW